MAEDREVIAIKPVIRRISPTGKDEGGKRKTAAYARVSTDSDEQQNSYQAQIDYYQKLISSDSKLELVKIYTDSGISGTSTRHRKGFNSMIADALDGRFSLIITKSVSRFARNTIDSLTSIRLLKEHNVEVYFEKENIWTFDSKGELLITIMSSLAQEESRSISENVKWGRRKRFADGQVTVPFSRFLGYYKGPDGNLIINVEQAKLVRYIYALYLQGVSPNAIARRLTNEGYKTVTGKAVWHSTTIAHVLCNEKYKGDALLQKYYIPDFLTKIPVANKGEVPQYYVQDNHEPIISRDVFDLVQQEIQDRKNHSEKGKGLSVFSGGIRCGICGGTFGSKVWHSNDRYRKVIWQCNDKYAHKGKTCTSPHLSEEELKALFVRALNKLIPRRDQIIGGFDEIKEAVFDTAAQEAELGHLKDERIGIISLMENLTTENASVAMSQDEYRTRFEKLSERYNAVNNTLAVLEEAIRDRQYRKTKTELFLKTLGKQEELVTEFSEKLWYALADHAVVYGKEDVRFIFKNGMEIK
jgi:site-specific DNA recombinase